MEVSLPLRLPADVEIHTRMPKDLSHLEFDRAFARAREADATSFSWRGHWYHTLTAEELENDQRPWTEREDRILLVAMLSEQPRIQPVIALLRRSQTDCLARFDELVPDQSREGRERAFDDLAQRGLQSRLRDGARHE